VNSLKIWKTNKGVFWYPSVRPRAFARFAQWLIRPLDAVVKQYEPFSGNFVDKSQIFLQKTRLQSWSVNGEKLLKQNVQPANSPDYAKYILLKYILWMFTCLRAFDYFSVNTRFNLILFLKILAKSASTHLFSQVPLLKRDIRAAIILLQQQHM